MPYARTTDRLISIKWSPTLGRTLDAAHPAIAPITALTTTTETNVMPVSSGEVGVRLLTKPTAIVKATMPVPSLKMLSASTNVARRRGEARLLNVAMTAAGSVAASIAPTTKACSGGNPAPTCRNRVTSPALTRTPGPARSDTPSSDGRSLPKSIWYEASKTRAGSRTTSTSWGVISTRSGEKSAPATIPKATSATV